MISFGFGLNVLTSTFDLIGLISNLVSGFRLDFHFNVLES